MYSQNNNKVLYVQNTNKDNNIDVHECVATGVLTPNRQLSNRAD